MRMPGSDMGWDNTFLRGRLGVQPSIFGRASAGPTHGLVPRAGRPQHIVAVPSRPLLDVSNPLPGQQSHALGHARCMNKNLAAAAVGLDEAEAFLRVVPLNNTFCHLFVCSVFSEVSRAKARARSLRQRLRQAAVRSPPASRSLNQHKQEGVRRERRVREQRRDVRVERRR
jgi:hypothetical protein